LNYQEQKKKQISNASKSSKFDLAPRHEIKSFVIFEYFCQFNKRYSWIMLYLKSLVISSFQSVIWPLIYEK